MKRLKTRLLDQRRDETQPAPVYITFGRGVTSREALAAAIEAGMVPAKAWIVLLPQQAASHEEWMADVQADVAERERRRAEVQKQQEAPAGTKPDGQP